MLKVNVGGELFLATKETLCKCGYFSGLIDIPDFDPEKEILLDRDNKGFAHVLRYLRDDKYPFPTKYIYELDFYSVPYPKYSQNRRRDLVVILANGAKFKVKASLLMRKSQYLENKLAVLYVGQDLCLRTDSKAVAHLLNRISNSEHYIPEKYIRLLKKYDYPLISWKPETMVSYYVTGQKFATCYKILAQIPSLKEALKAGYMPNVKNCSSKAWANVLHHLETGQGALQKYEKIYAKFGLTVTDWSKICYFRCPMDGCACLSKIVADGKTYTLTDESNSPYCISHSCLYCRNGVVSKNKKVCKDHIDK